MHPTSRPPGVNRSQPSVARFTAARRGARAATSHGDPRARSAGSRFDEYGPIRRRAGLTLIEVLAALTVISILLAASVPSAIRTMEQSHADLAGAELKAIWNAQRFYWLNHREYAPDLGTLASAGLLDPALTSANRRYRLAVAAASATAFAATATRSGSLVWSGQLAIDETGTMTGGVQKTGADYVLTPGFY